MTQQKWPRVGQSRAHQQVLHVPHGLVDVVQNLSAALGRQLHLLPFRRLLCGRGSDQPW